MSNRFDDIIREKLNNYRVSYNPGDWEDMEAMLDKGGGNKIGGGWIWKLSILGLLLLGTIAALNIDNFSENGGQTDSEIVIDENSLISHFEASIPGDCIDEFMDPYKTTNNSSRQSFVTEDNSNTNQEKIYQEELVQNVKLSKESSQPPIEEVQSSSLALNSDKKQVKKVENDRNNEIKVATQSPEVNNSLDIESIEKSELYAGKIKNENKFAASDLLALVEENEFAVIPEKKVINALNFNYINPYSAFSRKEKNHSFLLREYEEGNTSKRLNWMFDFGLNSGISYSYLDDNLLATPGFTIGLNAESIFKNKFGFYTGISYTAQEYETSKFECEPGTRYRCPVYYSSIIKSIEVPLGIRYNFVRKGNWMVFAKAGISNFIKFEEKFNYIFEPDNSEPPPPRTNSFVTNQATSSLDRSFSRDFTLSEEKRYHFSYMAAAGVERYVSRQMSVSLEPSFQVTGTKVGNKDARLYTYSMIASLKFYPGR